MTSRELLYVKTVADEKNISKAAKKLFVAQPSLSQSISRIEDTIGVKLFVRGSNGLHLTYAGERYYQMACQILKIYDNFEAEITDINDLRVGRIYFGITNHLGAIVLPHILPEFQQLCPNITWDVFEGSTEPQESRLVSGDLDFSIMHAPAEDNEANPSLNYEILTDHPFVIAMSKDNPLVKQAVPAEGYDYPVLDVELLRDEPLLTLFKEQRIRHVTDAVLKKAGITPKIRLQTRNYMTTERLAALNMGYTMLPSDYVNQNRFQNPPVYLSIDKKYNAYWSLCIATLKDAYLSKADQCLLDILRKRACEI